MSKGKILESEKPPLRSLENQGSFLGFFEGWRDLGASELRNRAIKQGSFEGFFLFYKSVKLFSMSEIEKLCYIFAEALSGGDKSKVEVDIRLYSKLKKQKVDKNKLKLLSSRYGLYQLAGIQLRFENYSIEGFLQSEDLQSAEFQRCMKEVLGIKTHEALKSAAEKLLYAISDGWSGRALIRTAINRLYYLRWNTLEYDKLYKKLKEVLVNFKSTPYF